MTARNRLRRRLKTQRRAVERVRQHAAARTVARDAALRRLLGTRERVALYLASGGELDPGLLIRWLWRAGRTPYLPVLHPHRARAMRFAPYLPSSCMAPNRFGIPEPVVAARARLSASDLDLILMPVVGFDDRGNRLGMGGGFYDRTLAFLGHRRRWRRPLLIGLAYECQRVPSLSARSWDIPLDGVVTEAGLQRFCAGSH